MNSLYATHEVLTAPTPTDRPTITWPRNMCMHSASARQALGGLYLRLVGRLRMNQGTAATHPDPHVREASRLRAEGLATAVLDAASAVTEAGGVILEPTGAR